MRISNLIWQSAYSELYFSKKLWPDFRKEDLDEAINEYARRKDALEVFDNGGYIC